MVKHLNAKKLQTLLDVPRKVAALETLNDILDELMKITTTGWW